MPKWNMSRSKGKSEDKSENKPEVGERQGWHNVNCKCGHAQSVPGGEREDAEEWAEKNTCDDCYDKKDVQWNTDHYAEMKVYTAKRRADKLAEAKRAKAADRARKIAENKMKKTKKAAELKKSRKKGGSAGFKIED